MVAIFLQETEVTSITTARRATLAYISAPMMRPGEVNNCRSSEQSSRSLTIPLFSLFISSSPAWNRLYNNVLTSPLVSGEL
ncbi:hypothetical protein M758_1G074900 [Ceratodon purpureus]|nr:hypothetical protein M758_1G074900 [Ceratodon purpureus]